MFSRETNWGKGRDLADLGRKKHGKIEGQGDRKSWSHMYGWLVS